MTGSDAPSSRDANETDYTANEPRGYTLRIEIEVRDQDDFKHFQPNTVTGRAPQLGVEWVSSNDVEALHDFFRFFLTRVFVDVTKNGDAETSIREIVRRTLEPVNDGQPQ